MGELERARVHWSSLLWCTRMLCHTYSNYWFYLILTNFVVYPCVSFAQVFPGNLPVQTSEWRVESRMNDAFDRENQYLRYDLDRPFDSRAILLSFSQGFSLYDIQCLLLLKNGSTTQVGRGFANFFQEKHEKYRLNVNFLQHSTSVRYSTLSWISIQEYDLLLSRPPTLIRHCRTFMAKRLRRAGSHT